MNISKKLLDKLKDVSQALEAAMYEEYDMGRGYGLNANAVSKNSDHGSL